ncbi:hypothetical protein KKH23_07710, partial [Patescibacteria group bacterium]|nr:hypothetical protein [Patescibacteria group bacterium]
MEINEITCNRKIGDGVCGVKIPLVRKNLRVYNTKTGIISAICPECSKGQLLGKQLSKILMEREFNGESPPDVGDTHNETRGESGEGTDNSGEGGSCNDGGDGDLTGASSTAGMTRTQHIEREAPAEPLFPSTSFSDKVIKTLDIFGIRGAKYKDKMALLTDFVKTVPMYQTPQGLHTLLVTMGFVDVQLIPLIITRIFGSIDGNPAPQGMGYTGFQGGMQYPFSNPPTNPSPGGMPIIQQLPNGQIIVIPPTPNPSPAPYYQPAPARMGRSEDESTMEEVIDKDGRVTKRIYHGADARKTAPDTGDTLLKALITFRELGIIGGGAGKSGDQDTQIAVLAQRIESKFNEMRSELSASSRRDPEVEELRRLL